MAARIIFNNFDFINVSGIDLVKQRDFSLAKLMYKCLFKLNFKYCCCDYFKYITYIKT